jgi:1-acyl-sn-glycerol-3-phosphate acyltransferase
MVRRRIVALPLTVLGFPILVAVAPVVLCLTLLADLVTAPRRLPASRLFLAVVGYWWFAVSAQFRIFWVWALSGFGLRNWEEPTQSRLRDLTRWWTTSVVRMYSVTVGCRFDIEDAEDLQHGPLIVLPRHVSLLDALFAPGLIMQGPGMAVRLVMTKGLRSEPSLDMVAHRAPHHFVERGGSNSKAEIEAVGRLADGIDENIAVVLYPEGGLARPALRERIISKLSDSDPAAAERARALRHLLPVRPGGVISLMGRAPAGTDVALVGHVGFDQLSDPKTLWRNVPLRTPVRARVFRYAAAEIPEGESARLEWLADRWQDLDDWVAATRAERDADVSSA